MAKLSLAPSKVLINNLASGLLANDDDDDDEGRINFSVALSPKTTRTRNNKPKQWSHVIVANGWEEQKREIFYESAYASYYQNVIYCA